MENKKSVVEARIKSEMRDIILPALEEYYGKDSVLAVSNWEYTIGVDADENGETIWGNICFKTPRGERDGVGGYLPYDGLTAHEDYRFEQEKKERDKAEAQRKREKKQAEAEEKRRRKQAEREAKNVIKGMKKEVRENIDLSSHDEVTA